MEIFASSQSFTHLNFILASFLFFVLFTEAVQEFQSSSENTAIATPDFENELKYQKEALERALHQKVSL